MEFGLVLVENIVLWLDSLEHIVESLESTAEKSQWVDN